MTGELLPALCAWATELMNARLCARFAFDTYDREVERYGGTLGIDLAEEIFAADSRAVVRLLALMHERTVQLDRMLLGVVSIDDLLQGLGLAVNDRLRWYHEQDMARNAVGPLYRQQKQVLRSLLADEQYLVREPGGAAVLQVLADRRAALTPPAERLQALAKQGKLAQPLFMLYRSVVHLHCNRLFGVDGTDEQMLIGLLVRTLEGLERTRRPCDA